MKKTRDVWDIIKEYKESAHLQPRLVGSAPTNEWTGLADLRLLGALDYADVEHTRFISDVKGQPLFGKKCVRFVTFGIISQN